MTRVKSHSAAGGHGRVLLRVLSLSLLTTLVALGQNSKTWPDHSVKEFPKELAGNFRGLLDGDNLAPALVGGFTAGSSTLLDDRIERYFLEERRAKVYGDAGGIAGGPYVTGGMIGGLFLLGRVAEDDRFRAMTYSLAQASTISIGLNLAAKGVFKRERPDGGDKRSFPSSHSSNAFAWATVVSQYYGTRAAIPSYLAAAFISSSRLEKNRHHLSDIVAGAAIGYIVGTTVSRRERRNQSRRVRWNLTALPGRGIFLTAQVSFCRSAERW